MSGDSGKFSSHLFECDKLLAKGRGLGRSGQFEFGRFRQDQTKDKGVRLIVVTHNSINYILKYQLLRRRDFCQAL